MKREIWIKLAYIKGKKDYDLHLNLITVLVKFFLVSDDRKIYPTRSDNKGILITH